MATNPTQTKGPYIGIDFGTTKTMVAEFDPAKRFPKVRKLGRQSDEMPTSMYVAEDGQVLFGDYADDEGGHDCLGYIRRFKMDLGKTTKRPFGRQLVKPVHLTERFLADLRTRLESEVCHRPVELAVITVPATFGPAQRKDLEQAASGAGFQEVVLLSEPEAAGLAYCEQNTDLSSKQRFLVADWGGGTFDLAVLERDESGTSRVLDDYVDGLSGIGGEDLDDLLWDAASEMLVGAGFPPLEKQPRMHWARYRRHITEIKKSLSVKPEITAGFALENGDFARRSVTRSELEEIIGGKVLEGAGRVADLVKRCRADKCDLDYILLAGGTSLIPLIPLKFEQAAGLKCRRWAEGRDAIALGAAIHAFRVFGAEEPTGPKPKPKPSSRTTKSSPPKKPKIRSLEVTCPTCGEAVDGVSGTGDWECPECGEGFQVGCECPECGQEVEIDGWGVYSCPDCGSEFEAADAANIVGNDDYVEDEVDDEDDEDDQHADVCPKCGTHLPAGVTRCWNKVCSYVVPHGKHAGVCPKCGTPLAAAATRCWNNGCSYVFLGNGQGIKATTNEIDPILEISERKLVLLLVLPPSMSNTLEACIAAEAEGYMNKIRGVVICGYEMNAWFFPTSLEKYLKALRLAQFGCVLFEKRRVVGNSIANSIDQKGYSSALQRVLRQYREESGSKSTRKRIK